MIKSTAAQSILRAAHNYLKKIDWVMEHNPEDIGELACLYAGISGINECIKALREDGLITEREEELLGVEMEKLYTHCQIK
ncbi:MAG: hypothetical protein JXR86_11520 [Spirochaetales bacterium]|nr:hypothetical protein [Spirochaetales bacterium]